MCLDGVEVVYYEVSIARKGLMVVAVAVVVITMIAIIITTAALIVIIAVIVVTIAIILCGASVFICHVTASEELFPLNIPPQSREVVRPIPRRPEGT